MPQHHTLAIAAAGQPRLPEELPDDVLTRVGFRYLGELRRPAVRPSPISGSCSGTSGWRFRSRNRVPPIPNKTGRQWHSRCGWKPCGGALDGATAAIGALLEDAVPSGKSNIRGVIEK